MTLLKTLMPAVLATVLCSTFSAVANAQDKVRLAYFKTITLAPFYHAQEKGYFKDEGVDLEMIQVQNGSAAAAALSNGSADVAYGALQSTISARKQSLPYKVIIGLAWEKIPENPFGGLIASRRSGVTSAQDLIGKTILMNAPGGACELTWRSFLDANGIAWNQVKIITLPFSQIQAMLELGTADAACTVEPFTAIMKQSAVDPVVISHGIRADTGSRYLVDNLYATDSWIKQNAKTINAMKRALGRATQELTNNPEELHRILTREYRLPAATAQGLKFNFDFALNSDATDIQPVLSSMERYQMVEPGLTAAELIDATY